MRRDDLKSKARELERSGQLQAAVEIYRGLADDEESPSPAVLLRIGDLLFQAGDADGSRASLIRAIDLFESAGQRNNALAAAVRLFSSMPDDAEVRLRIGRLAVLQGYRETARSAAVAVLSAGDATLLDEPVSDLFLAYLLTFPDDLLLCRSWLDGLIRAGREEQAIAHLTHLVGRLTEAGDSSGASRFRDELARIRRSNTEKAPEKLPGGDAPGAVEDDVLMDLIGPGPFAPQPAAEVADLADIEILPLHGLEPTHEALWHDDSERTGDDLEPGEEPGTLPLIYPDTEDGPWGGAGAADQEPFEPPPPLILDAAWGIIPEGADESDIERTDSTASAELSESRESDAEDFEEEGLDEDVTGDPLPLLEWHDAPAAERSPPDPAESPPTADRDPRQDIASGDGPARPVQDVDLGQVRQELASLSRHHVEPSDPATHYDLGVAFKEMGLLDEAVAQLSAALETGFNPFATLEVLGEILVGRGENELAARLLRPGLRADTSLDQNLVGVLYWLGRSEESLGNAAEARQILRRVVDADPDFKDASIRLQRSASSGF
jgi:tetratricopeptide (TPR) repeat protein